MSKGDISLIKTIAVIFILVAGSMLIINPLIKDVTRKFCQTSFNEFIDKLEQNACSLNPGDPVVKKELDLIGSYGSCADYIYYKEDEEKLYYKFKGEPEKTRESTCNHITYVGFRKDDPNPPVVSTESQKIQRRDDSNWKYKIEVRSGEIILESEKEFMLDDVKNIFDCVYNSCKNEMKDITEIPEKCNSQLHHGNTIKNKNVGCFKSGNDDSYIEYIPISNLILKSDNFGWSDFKAGIPKECGKLFDPSSSTAKSVITDKHYYISSILANLNTRPGLTCQITETDTERNYCCDNTPRTLVRTDDRDLDCNFEASKTLKIFAKNDGGNVAVYVCGANEDVIN